MLHHPCRGNGRIRTRTFKRPNAVKAVQVPPEHHDSCGENDKRHADFHKRETCSHRKLHKKGFNFPEIKSGTRVESGSGISELSAPIRNDG